MILTVRPIDKWPRPETKARTGSPFQSTYGATLGLLDHELDMLNASHPVLMLDVTEDDLRLDGSVRANANPSSPRVILAFDTPNGPLKFPCDRFTDWRANVRAIALGLQALRRVERYGITQHGEQYTGWKQLPPSAIALGAHPMSREEAAELLVRTAGESWHGGDVQDAIDALLHDTKLLLPDVFRYAAKLAHPDQGGNEEAFKRVGQARDLLAMEAS